MGHRVHESPLFTSILDDSEQHSPSNSPALTYVNLLAILAGLSGSNDESLPSHSRLMKMGIAGSPKEIWPPVFEQGHIAYAESPGLDISGEKTRKKVLQSKPLVSKSKTEAFVPVAPEQAIAEEMVSGADKLHATKVAPLAFESARAAKKTRKE